MPFYGLAIELLANGFDFFDVLLLLKHIIVHLVPLKVLVRVPADTFVLQILLDEVVVVCVVVGADGGDAAD